MEHGADTGKHVDKQSRRRRAPILGSAYVACWAGWNMAQEEKKPPFHAQSVCWQGTQQFYHGQLSSQYGLSWEFARGVVRA